MALTQNHLRPSSNCKILTPAVILADIHFMISSQYTAKIFLGEIIKEQVIRDDVDVTVCSLDCDAFRGVICLPLHMRGYCCTNNNLRWDPWCIATKSLTLGTLSFGPGLLYSYCTKTRYISPANFTRGHKGIQLT